MRMKRSGLWNIVALVALVGAFLIGLWRATPPPDPGLAKSSANIGQVKPPVDVGGASVNSTTVIIDGFAYNPPVLTVPRGTTVTWINKYAVPHRVSSVGASPNFSSPSLSTGTSFTWTFPDAGSYAYYCTIHPTMQGTIVVK